MTVLTKCEKVLKSLKLGDMVPHLRVYVLLLVIVGRGLEVLELGYIGSQKEGGIKDFSPPLVVAVCESQNFP